jgi:MoxR-like ATPase
MSEKLMYQQNINKIKKCLKKKKPIMCVGEAGFGKSFSSRRACEQASRQYKAINLSKQKDEVDIIGQYLVMNNGETIWNPRIAQTCAEKGFVFIAEELTMSDPSIMASLHGLFEEEPHLDTMNGEVAVHDEFRVIATANPTWTNYSGLTELNYALADRFVTIEFGFPTKSDFEILMGPYQDNLEKEKINTNELYNLSKQLFKMYIEEETDYYISLRGMEFFADLCEDFPRRTAFELAFYNKVDPENRAKLKDYVDNFVPMGTVSASK